MDGKSVSLRGFLATSEMQLFTMPVKLYNQPFNTHFNMHNLLKHQHSIPGPLMNFAKKYNFLKNLKSTSSSYSMQSMNLHGKSIEWFLF